MCVPRAQVLRHARLGGADGTRLVSRVRPQVLRHAWLCGADGAHDHVIDQAVQQRLGKLMEGRYGREPP
jgi:hypothetical protein